MEPVKLILLPNSRVLIIYDTDMEEAFKARGILMKPWGIKATLEGKKTQTRRIRFDGNPGELLYIRESYSPYANNTFVYRYDYEESNNKRWKKKWTPSIHMPRTAARYWLYIEDVQDKRVQDILREDAKKEGIPETYGELQGKLLSIFQDKASHFFDNRTTVENFSIVWDFINGNRQDKHGNRLPYSWEDNPIVHAVSYRFFFQGRGWWSEKDLSCLQTGNIVKTKH